MHGFISNVAPSSEEPTRPPAVHSQQAIGAIADAWLANTQGDDQVLNGPSLPPLPSPQVNAESALSPISVPIESSPTPPPSTETYLQVQTVDIIQEPTVAFSEPEIADEYLNPITSSELLPEHNLSLNETTNSDVSAQTDSVPTICRLCGDSGLDSTQVVTLDGNEVACDIFDLIFRSANIFGVPIIVASTSARAVARPLSMMGKVASENASFAVILLRERTWTLLYSSPVR